MRHRSLPRVLIPVPCYADWNRMQPIDRDGRARQCGACDKPVYDSKAMTRAELERLIAKLEGERLPCLRLHLRPDGTIVTKNCFAPAIRAGRWLWWKASLAAVAFWTAVFGLRSGSRWAYDGATKPEPVKESHRQSQGMVADRRVLRLRLEPEYGFAGEAVLAEAEMAGRERRARAEALARSHGLLFGDADQGPPLRVLEAEEGMLESSLTPR